MQNYERSNKIRFNVITNVYNSFERIRRASLRINKFRRLCAR